MVVFFNCFAVEVCDWRLFSGWQDLEINVKTLFAITRSLRREVGMSKALQILGMPLEGTHHRGGDDAWNIAGILCDILGRCRTS